MFQKNKTENYTWVTLLATDDYVSGVIGLNYSLLKVKSKYPLLVLAVDTLKKSTFQLLETENIKYTYGEITDENAYSVDVVWTYTEEKFSDYQQKANLTFVHKDNKLYLVELK